MAVAGAVASGLAIGTLHAWLITSIGLPPFVATLASLVGLRSLARIMNQAVTDSLGQRVTTFPFLSRATIRYFSAAPAHIANFRSKRMAHC